MSAYSEESTFEKAFSNNRLGRNSLLQMKCFLFVGANTAGTKQQLRMHKTIQLNPHKPSWQTGSISLGQIRWGRKMFSPNPPARWVKKSYSLFFSRKYEIHKDT